MKIYKNKYVFIHFILKDWDQNRNSGRFSESSFFLIIPHFFCIFLIFYSDHVLISQAEQKTL